MTSLQTNLFGAAPAVNTDQDALGFLLKFVRKHRGKSFSSEQVTLSAMDAGIVFSDMRAWGSIFTAAARDGHIRRSDVAYRRVFGNGSLGLGWVAS